MANKFGGVSQFETLIVTQASSFPSESINPTAIATVPTAPMAAEKVEHQFAIHVPNGAGKNRSCLRTQAFDLDNGAGSTVDEVMIVPSRAVKLLSVYAQYEGATTGTVAAGNFKLGTTSGGSDLVAATAYENGKTVGTKTTATIASAAVAAGTPIFVRHTGVAATQAGLARVVIEYEFTDGYRDDAQIVHVARAAGEVLAVYATHETKPTGDQTLTYDVQKGNAATAFATVLTGTVELNSTIDDRDSAEGTPGASAAYAAGDLIKITATKGGSTGVNGLGAAIVIICREFPE